MYKIPDTIKEHISEPHVIGLFLAGDTEPSLTSLDDLISCSYDAPFCGGGLTIGALCSAHVTISSYGQHDLSGRDIVIRLGFGEPSEWIQMGVFRVTECQISDDTTSIVAYDAAYWATGIDYIPTLQPPASVRAVLEDVCSQCNIPLGDLPASADRVIDRPLTGFTARRIIMNMAAVCGCNALIDRSGALCLKWLSDNGQSVGPDEYYADELTNATTINIVGVQMKTKITTPSTDPDTGITVEHEEEKTYSSASGTGRVLAVDCLYANQALVDAVADDVAPLSYAIGNVSFVGGYDVEPGDMIEVTSLNGAVHIVPVLGLTLSLDGGCRATVQANGYSDTDTSANFDTEYQQTLRRIEADIIAVKNLTAENFEAQTAYIKNLSADEAFVNRLFSHDISGERLTIEMSQSFPMGGLLQHNYQRVYAGPSPLQGADSHIEFVSSRSPVRSTSSTLFVQPEKIGAVTDLFDVTGTISEGGTALADKYAAKSHGTHVPGIKSASGLTTLGWGTNNNYVPDISLLAFWNGAYIGTGSNLAYCNRGAFGTIVTKNAGDYSASNHNHNGVYAAASHTHSYFPTTGGTVSGSVFATGSIGATGCTTTTSGGANARVTGNGYIRTASSSSRRYKTAVEDLPLDTVRGLYSLPVHTYVYRADYLHEDDERYGKRIPGFIAEELEKILPIAVDHKDGKAEMWNSNIVVPCLLKLVQDLNERNESLEKRVKTLERKIAND